MRVFVSQFLANRLFFCVALCLSIIPIGCTRARVAGPLSPYAPGPPLPYVRGPVNDLAAVRAENHVSLTWTMPKKGTDRLSANGTIAVRVWRGEARTDLTQIGDTIHLTPGAAGSFSNIPEGSEFVVVETVRRTAGQYPWFHDEAGEKHQELRESLENLRGRPVAVGVHPPWLEHSPYVISGYVPDEDGVARTGVY